MLSLISWALTVCLAACAGRGEQRLKCLWEGLDQLSGGQSACTLNGVAWYTWLFEAGTVRTLEPIPSVWPHAGLRACPGCRYQVSSVLSAEPGQ